MRDGAGNIAAFGKSTVLPVISEYPEGIFTMEKFQESYVTITLDSGCCDHVADIIDIPGYQNHIQPSPGSRRGQNFVVGNGERLPNEGQIEVNMQANDDKEFFSVFQVAEVTRPLMSISRICEQGFVCVFDVNGAKVMNQQGETVCTFGRDGGLYTGKLKLKSPTPFTRQDR